LQNIRPKENLISVKTVDPLIGTKYRIKGTPVMWRNIEEKLPSVKTVASLFGT
jgi:hypothetical protein